MKTLLPSFLFALAATGLAFVLILSGNDVRPDPATWSVVFATTTLIITVVTAITISTGRLRKDDIVKRIAHGVVAAITALSAVVLAVVLVPVARAQDNFPDNYALVLMTLGAGSFGICVCGLLLMTLIAFLSSRHPRRVENAQ